MDILGTSIKLAICCRKQSLKEIFIDLLFVITSNASCCTYVVSFIFVVLCGSVEFNCIHRSGSMLLSYVREDDLVAVVIFA